jgi:hypothetical protein
MLELLSALSQSFFINSGSENVKSRALCKEEKTMAPSRRNKKNGDDPIMWEVDDNSGNDPLGTSSGGKVDKGDELMKNFTKGKKGNEEEDQSKMTPQQRKEFNKFVRQLHLFPFVFFLSIF